MVISIDFPESFCFRHFHAMATGIAPNRANRNTPLKRSRGRNAFGNAMATRSGGQKVSNVACIRNFWPFVIVNGTVLGQIRPSSSTTCIVLVHISEELDGCNASSMKSTHPNPTPNTEVTSAKNENSGSANPADCRSFSNTASSVSGDAGTCAMIFSSLTLLSNEWPKVTISHNTYITQDIPEPKRIDKAHSLMFLSTAEKTDETML
mmetsp:Transcript_11125/g.24084  ORF Transcript_11125/g.24084 Transcript_11125/m.24084 type:complete len:207 (+) Transcript_11125:184-804(+)